MAQGKDANGSILDAVKSCLAAGEPAKAIQRLRHADASGGLRRDAGLLKECRQALGVEATDELVKALAGQKCPYCTSGRERCADCDGSGTADDDSPCRYCASLGVKRCPFCNGTGFAGFDFVPRGFRPAVLGLRVQFASRQISVLKKAAADPPAGARECTAQVLAVVRCRGILSNAIEQSRTSETAAPDRPAPGSQALFGAEQRARIEEVCLRENARAEKAVRALLVALADRTKSPDRSKMLRALSRSPMFGSSVLQTPPPLRLK